MEDFVSDIYKYAELIPLCKRLKEAAVTGQEGLTRTIMENMLPMTQALVDRFALEKSVLGEKLFTEWQNVNESYGKGLLFFSEMADNTDILLETLYEIVEGNCGIDVSDGDYRIISSRSSFLTIQDITTQNYIHSKDDPVFEAWTMAKQIYLPEYTSFAFLGVGLGYLPEAVFSLSDKSADIFIFTANKRMVEYATHYGVLSNINQDKLHIVIEEDSYRLLDAFSDPLDTNGKTGYYCLPDEAAKLDDIGREVLNDFYFSSHTVMVFKDLCRINAWRNKKNVGRYYRDELFEKKEDWIVVAGGPSLDANIDYIKSNLHKEIICVSTVYRKLLQNDIHPDFVCVADPQARTWKHMDNIDDHSSIMLMDVTANWRFGECYKGDIYIVPTMNSYGIDVPELPLEDYWYVAGTVTTLALEAAVRMGASKVELIGVDMAYPEGKSHATGTLDARNLNTKGMPLVDSVDGGKVPTTEQFKTYISYIEDKLRDYSYVEFINRSDNGAKINGARWYRE